MASSYGSITKPFILVLLLLVSTSSFSKRHPCSPKQQNALLQFKDSFGIRKLSWKNDTDCCIWDDVTCNDRTGDVIGLDFSYFGLRGTIDNGSSLLLLQNLQSLNLSYNALSGSLNFLSQLSGLMHLDLFSNSFAGIVPREIAHLSQLVSLNLSRNNLTFPSSILELLIQNSTHIEELNLEGVRVDGLASSLSNLPSTLTSLTVSNCGLIGRFPDYVFHLPNLRTLKVGENLGLTGTLPSLNWNSPLISLNLSFTGFHGNIPKSIGNLKNLENLTLHSCHFTNLIPSSICSLSSLRVLDLSSNIFSGFIPQCLGNMTDLRWLDMSLNQLTGPLPQSLNNCTLLEHVNISSNMLSDTSPFWLGPLPRLTVVDLGQNRFSGPIGKICIGSMLRILILHQNNFSGHLPDFDSHLRLNVLDLSDNSLEGPIPKLPQVDYLLLLSNNKFTGEIPPSICELLPIILDLSNNSLIGTIPPCLLNRGYVINLGMNKLEAAIPDIFAENTSIRALDLNGNQLTGPLPRSMVRCKLLVLLDLSKNNIEDSFPNWLETLPELQVLVLQSNRFNGKIKTMMDHPFHKLRLFDISYNNLSGHIPIKYIGQLDSIKNAYISRDSLQYWGKYDMYANLKAYFLKITLTMKGCRLQIVKISPALTSIDFSNNNFQGEVPEDIGELVGLKGLNLSHNNLTGSIPLSIQNLTNLEWLDLSSNKLSGLIPSELTRLTELGSLNLSYNELRGMIPTGQQFGTFGMESFIGNTGLCGSQIAKPCDESDIPKQPQLSLPSAEEDEFSVLDWKIILMGYGCGLVIGISIGYVVFELRRPKCFVLLVEEKLLKKRAMSTR